MRQNLPIFPVSLFGIVLGVIGIGMAWRAAARVLDWPRGWFHAGGPGPVIAEAILALGVLIWLVLIALYVCKWAFARPRALAEARDPVQGGFVSLVPVSTMLVGLALATHARDVAVVLLIIGAATQLSVGAAFVGGLWRGGRDAASSMPVLYLPGVASNFVTAILAGTLGFNHVATLFFGAGLFYWIAVESVILQGIATHDPLPPARRPLLGIQLAPPAVGCVAYLSITTGPPDIFAQLLYGYAVFCGLVLMLLGPWIWRPPGFSSGYWSFAFGGTAIATAGLRFVDRGYNGPVAWLAAPVFIGSNLLIAGLLVGTILLLLRGELGAPPVQRVSSPDS